MHDIATLMSLNDMALDNFVATISRMPEDKLSWTPIEGTRNVRDMMHEVAEASNWFAEAVENKSAEKLQWQIWAEKLKEHAPEDQTLDDLIKRCRDGNERLKTAYAKLSDDELDTVLPGSHMEPTPRKLAMFPVRNTWYHMGQVNYIQTCYGDHEM
ncbi:MAG: DinB family protein [Fimbriimonadaceae bacterium]